MKVKTSLGFRGHLNTNSPDDMVLLINRVISVAGGRTILLSWPFG